MGSGAFPTGKLCCTLGRDSSAANPAVTAQIARLMRLRQTRLV
jgi:hypothetical protein